MYLQNYRIELGLKCLGGNMKSKGGPATQVGSYAVIHVEPEIPSELSCIYT